jgi:hypothetical protein
MLNDIRFKASQLASPILGLTLGCCMTAALAFEDAPTNQVPVETAPAASSAAAPAAAETKQAKDWDTVMQLGHIEVQGDRDEASRKIVAGLKVIKRALVANLSNDPADANQVVCRVNYDTGSHLNAHLMCATNRTLMLDHDAQRAGMQAVGSGQPSGAATQALEHLTGEGHTDRYFSTHVSASELQKLLLVVKCEGCSNNGLVVGNN